MRDELVRVGKGKKAHRRYDYEQYAWCGQWGVTNSKNVEGLPLCKTCARCYAAFIKTRGSLNEEVIKWVSKG